MGTLLNLLGAPIQALLSSAGDIIGKFVTDPTERLKATMELQRLQMDFQMKLLDADAQFAAQQSAVIQTEAKAESWLTRTWRPITMLVLVYIVAHNFIFAPLFGLASLPIPPDLWGLLKIGVGGYVMGRSLEKMVPSAASAVAGKKS